MPARARSRAVWISTTDSIPGLCPKVTTSARVQVEGCSLSRSFEERSWVE